MTPSIFNLPEIITPIIQSLETDSLHACLMVNRTWCSIAVPILWLYPFGDQWDGSHHKIVPVYLGCLEKGTKVWIKELCEKFPDSALTTPAFNYIKYLRKFNFQALYHAVKVWCNEQEIDSFLLSEDTPLVRDLKLDPITTLLDFLINCIMGQSLNLKRLEISVMSQREGEYVNLENCLFSRQCLAKIDSLECDDCIQDNLIFASEYCTNLIHLKIDCSWGNDEEVSAFIRSQKNLQRLTISKRWPQMKDVLESEYLCNSLKFVELKNNMNLVDNSGPLNVLSALKNLEILRFEKWRTFREDDIMELASISFPRLRRIDFTHSRLSPQAINLMITVNGAHLQELTLNWECENSTNRLPQVIKTVAENCPNIIFFDVPVQHKEMHELYQLLRSCEKLESLIINDSEDEQADVDYFLPVMGIIIPRSLRQLRIFASWRFSADTLHKFLMETCKAQLICIGFYRCINDEHLEVITEYACARKTLCILELRWCETTCSARKKARDYIQSVQVYDQMGRLTEYQ